MTERHDSENPWPELAALVRSLPESQRSQLSEAFRTFAHDLRQHLGQIYSAQELLDRLLEGRDPTDDVLEMLNVIKVANGNARQLLRTFVAGWVEGLADEDQVEP